MFLIRQKSRAVPGTGRRLFFGFYDPCDYHGRGQAERMQIAKAEAMATGRITNQEQRGQDDLPAFSSKIPDSFS
jgi:hypothetical protein